ncbi:hypothetical protein ACFO5O_03260 [Geojedonia litorea]|uniref:Lipoprotein n=1 Tax=Geojedonia litorea TaxID=1268269 RepID=A0ABV9N2Y8_9FLAO
MKKHVMLMSLMALFFFGCSTSETESIQEPNLSFSHSKVVTDLITNSDFTSYLKTKSKESKFYNSRSSNSNGNGVVFVEGGGAFSNFVGIVAFPYLVLVYDLNDVDFPEPLIDVKVFDENRAQFTANVKRPGVEISNLFTGDIMYSNICDDKKIGHLQINVIAPYDVLDFGFGPMYFPNGPEAMTSNNLQLSARVNDSFVLTNPETGEGECYDANNTKNIKLVSIFRDNNDQELGRIFKIIGLE